MTSADGFAKIPAEVKGRPLLMGDVERYFIGDGDWETVMVMWFPSRPAVVETLNHDRYAELHRHRDAGLLWQELLTTRPDAGLRHRDASSTG